MEEKDLPTGANTQVLRELKLGEARSEEDSLCYSQSRSSIESSGGNPSARLTYQTTPPPLESRWSQARHDLTAISPSVHRSPSPLSDALLFQLSDIGSPDIPVHLQQSASHGSSVAAHHSPFVARTDLLKAGASPDTAGESRSVFGDRPLQPDLAETPGNKSDSTIAARAPDVAVLTADDSTPSSSHQSPIRFHDHERIVIASNATAKDEDAHVPRVLFAEDAPTIIEFTADQGDVAEQDTGAGTEKHTLAQPASSIPVKLRALCGPEHADCSAGPLPPPPPATLPTVPAPHEHVRTNGAGYGQGLQAGFLPVPFNHGHHLPHRGAPTPPPVPYARILTCDAAENAGDRAAQMAPKERHTASSVAHGRQRACTPPHETSPRSALKTLATTWSTGSNDSASSAGTVPRACIADESQNLELPRTASRSLYELRCKFDSLQTRYLQTVFGTSHTGLARSTTQSSHAVAPTVGRLPSSLTPSASKLCRERLDSISYERRRP